MARRVFYCSWLLANIITPMGRLAEWNACKLRFAAKDAPFDIRCLRGYASQHLG